MDEHPVDRSPTRQRSRGFPILDLLRVVEALREVSKYGMRQPRAAFAERLGHTTPDSGPFRRKLAAFREFGLVLPRGDEVVFTDLGQQLAVPVNARAELDAVRRAFFECRLFSELYEVLAKDSDLDLKSIAATAFHQFGVSVSTRDVCAASFAASASFAGLAALGNEGAFKLIDQRELGPPPSESGLSSLTSESVRPTSLNGDVGTNISLEYPLPDGVVALRLQLGRALPASVFRAFQEAAEAVERLAHELGSSDETAS
jgi:hypothetical protein